MYVGPGPGQGQLPWMMNSLRDNRTARIGQFPPLANLGVRPRILKSRGECLELFGDPIERCVVNARIARRLAAGLVERVGEHQCDEQHRAFVAHIARSARRDLPAPVEQPPEMAEMRQTARASGWE